MKREELLDILRNGVSFVSAARAATWTGSPQTDHIQDTNLHDI